MSAESIFELLSAAGMSETGAYAMLGNIGAESAFISNNAQDGMTGLSDEEYTRLTDGGIYTDFVSDGVGYGLCQWTFPSRKAALLDYAGSTRRSVGDGTMQAEFIVRELKSDYPALWQYLCATDELSEAVGRICREYERPAVENVEERCAIARRLMRGESMGGAGETWVALSLRQLHRGHCGEDVRLWQYALGGMGFDCGAADGIFGSRTYSALTEFQRRKNLYDDGICGPLTWRALIKEVK